MGYAIDPETVTATVTGTVTIGSPLASSSVKTALFDSHGQNGQISQVHDLKVTEPFRLVGIPFEGTTVDANFWVVSTTGTASSGTQSAGKMSLASGTANSGYAQVQSVRKARFVFANPHISRQAIRVTSAVVALNTRRWGAYTTTTAPTPTDGFYFELSAAGALSVNAANGGSVTSVASGNFNGEGGATYTVDTNVHAYEIHYYVMGVEFWIDDVKIHTMVPTTTNLTGSYHLNSTAATVNGAAGTTSGTVEVWACSIARQGREFTLPTSYAHANGQTAGVVLKRSAGVLHGISIGQATNNAVITLYDSTAASGTVLGVWVVPNNSIIPVNMTGLNIPFHTGLTLTVTVQNAGITVMYE